MEWPQQLLITMLLRSLSMLSNMPPALNISVYLLRGLVLCRSTGHTADDDPYYISKLIINKIIDNMFKCSRSLNQDFENGT